MLMKFDSLHADTDCDCLGKGFENTEKLFSRRISKPQMKASDFYSHWERRKRPKLMDCDNICLFKGISINEWNDNTQAKIIKKYVGGLALQDLNDINKIRESVLIFKFKKKSGLLKPSPTKNDPSHYTFYKDDDFNIESIEVIHTIELKDYVKTKI
jgi:hypothetical protein